MERVEQHDTLYSSAHVIYRLNSQLMTHIHHEAFKPKEIITIMTLDIQQKRGNKVYNSCLEDMSGPHNAVNKAVIDNLISQMKRL